MFRAMIYGSVVLFIGSLLSGCATGKDVTFQNYTEERERLDTDVQGNAGFLMGTPPPEAVAGTQDKTRKFYVFEFTKKDKNSTEVADENLTETMPTKTDYHGSREYEAPKQYEEPSQKIVSNFAAPARTEQPVEKQVAAVATPSFVDYTIEKDDTLQKISKKFYNSYAKWQKIYDANKDRIKDPNNIKPGVVIQIPME